MLQALPCVITFSLKSIRDGRETIKTFGNLTLLSFSKRPKHHPNTIYKVFTIHTIALCKRLTKHKCSRWGKIQKKFILLKLCEVLTEGTKQGPHETSIIACPVCCRQESCCLFCILSYICSDSFVRIQLLIVQSYKQPHNGAPFHPTPKHTVGFTVLRRTGDGCDGMGEVVTTMVTRSYA